MEASTRETHKLAVKLPLFAADCLERRLKAPLLSKHPSL